MNKEQLELWDNLKANNSISEIQEYIKKIDEIRGFSDQSIEQAMLMLTEEIGELAKSVRKDKTTMTIDNNKIKNDSLCIKESEGYYLSYLSGNELIYNSYKEYSEIIAALREMFNDKFASQMQDLLGLRKLVNDAPIQ